MLDPSGPTILNLGCGRKTADDPRVLNLDWSIYLWLRSHPSVSWLAARTVLSADRKAKLEATPQNVQLADLTRGIPAESASVDMVFHSHFLEHVDRDSVATFLAEVQRVLRPGGLHRIVVPDLELVAREYVDHLDRCEAGEAEWQAHDSRVAGLLEQSVRKEPFGVDKSRSLRRRLEMVVVGDARRRGETHQWMYDRVNLASLLEEVGFSDVTVRQCNDSAFTDWPTLGLEVNADGSEYKRGSLYVECTR